jgi:hypothetical protein
VLNGPTSCVTLNVIVTTRTSLALHVSSFLKQLLEHINIFGVLQIRNYNVKEKDLAQRVPLSLKRALIPQNTRTEFKVTRIWTLNYDNMIDKMDHSMDFIQKALEVQIKEILEEIVLFSKKNIIYYYIDIESEPPSTSISNSTFQLAFG